MQSPISQCYICQSEFEYGLDGNPQTWSGIEYQEKCEICDKPVCFNKKCSITWYENSVETHRKICIYCREKITDQEFTQIKEGNCDDISKIREKYSPAPVISGKKNKTENLLADPAFGNIITALVVIFCITIFGLYKLFCLIF